MAVGADREIRRGEGGLSRRAGERSGANLLGAVEEDYRAGGWSHAGAGAAGGGAARGDGGDDSDRVAVEDRGIRLRLNAANGDLDGGRRLHVEAQHANAGLDVGGGGRGVVGGDLIDALGERGGGTGGHAGGVDVLGAKEG